jgi:hypothetical protein
MYMQELAGRLNPSTDKQLLLAPIKSKAKGSPATKAGGLSPASPVITAQVVQPGLDGKKGKAAEQDAAAPSPLMAFWYDPSLKPEPAPKAGARVGTSAEKSTQANPVVNPPTEATAADAREDILGPLGVAMTSMKEGVTLWPEQSQANLGAKAADRERTPVEAEVAVAKEEVKKAKWSLGEDLDKYRAHAVKEGSRASGQNIKKAFERAGLTLEDGVNVFLLGYASRRGEPFRANDGKGLLDEPGKAPQQAGATIGSAGLGLYSVADLVLLNGLPDPNAAPYQDNHPVVRPLLFTGRMVGGVWKTTEEVGNAVTWGYFDNVTGCIGMCIEDILEILKHAGEAVTNLVRGPVVAVAGNNEGVNRAMDWVLLVPVEFVTNAAQMKGIANMEDYKAAFEDKGVIGSVIELGGSGFLVYRGAKELVDRLDDNGHRRSRNHKASPDDPGTPDVPPDPGTPPPPLPDQVFLLDGPWPMENASGAVLIDGAWTAIKTWRE